MDRKTKESLTVIIIRTMLVSLVLGAFGVFFSFSGYPDPTGYILWVIRVLVLIVVIMGLFGAGTTAYKDLKGIIEEGKKPTKKLPG